MVWIIFILVVVSYLINYFVFNKSLNSLDYKLQSDLLVTEIDEPFEVRSVIDNNKKLPVVYMEAHLKFPPSFDYGFSQNNLYLGGYERIVLRHTQAGSKRGHYHIDNFKMVLGDFLGFHRYNMKYPANFDIFIRPKPMDLEKDLRTLDDTYGDISVKRWIMEDPQMIIGIREYTGTEPINRIHWPTSLRRGELHVKEFDYTSEQSAWVLLNMETGVPSWERPDEESIERSISRCRSVVEGFEAESIPYGFECNAYSYDNPQDRGYKLYPGLGPSHLDQLLFILARIDYKPGIRFFKLLERAAQTAAGNTVVVITPVVLEDYINHLNTLAKNASRVVLISEKNEFSHRLDHNIIIYLGGDK